MANGLSSQAQSNSTEASGDLLQLEETTVGKAIDAVASSVVQIETIGGKATDATVSTGTVVSPDGFVLTAAYNLLHEPTSIFINAVSSQSDVPKRFVAEIKAFDFSRNLCLLKANLSPQETLRPAYPAARSGLGFRIGHTCIAVGKVHDTKVPTVSVGIVSANGRIWGRAIQTDAKISRANYGGPLVNLKGHTIGILVPLTPDDNQVQAGTEWYDSGIGFAVPLDRYDVAIAKMADGVDLHRGLLGVSLVGSDLYADLPVIEYCLAKSPAANSGLRPGDTILAIDGQNIASQAQLKHTLGPKYAGDDIQLKVRGDDGVVREIVANLAQSIDPFTELAIGVVPDYQNGETNAKIGSVLPNSPASKAGLLPGDIVSSVNTTAILSWQDFRMAINQLSAGESIAIVTRNETQENRSDPSTKTLKLEPLSASMPPLDLPGDMPETENQSKQDDQQIGIDEVVISVAGFANLCTAYLPKSTNSDSLAGHAVLVWVAQPGTEDLSTIKSAIRDAVVQNRIAVLVPQSRDANQWSAEDSEFIVKSISRLKRKVRIDSRRVCIGGDSTAAMMACFTALNHRGTFRGLIMKDSLFPSRIPKIETRPDQRLMILLATTQKFEQLKRLKKINTILESKKIPTLLHSLENQSFARSMTQIVAWIKAIDRQ